MIKRILSHFPDKKKTSPENEVNLCQQFLPGEASPGLKRPEKALSRGAVGTGFSSVIAHSLLNI
jgi:hypothetical protein